MPQPHLIRNSCNPITPLESQPVRLALFMSGSCCAGFRFLIILLISTLGVPNLYAQDFGNYDSLILTKEGKLNNDNFPDFVLIKQDTTSEFRPFRLEIYFGTESGNKELVLVTDKAITPEYPQGQNTILDGEGFSDVSIQDQTLKITHELLRGHKEHSYRFRNNRFILVEYKYSESDGREKMYYEHIDF